MALQPSYACAVCFTDNGKARQAFIWTTVLMTVVPLLMVGVGVVVIRKLLKENNIDVPVALGEHRLDNATLAEKAGKSQ